MNGKIDKDGTLWIRRVNCLKKQYCPYDPMGEAVCGDSCPLFGDVTDEGVDGIHLDHCNRWGYLKFKEFVDEREKENNDRG